MKKNGFMITEFLTYFFIMALLIALCVQTSSQYQLLINRTEASIKQKVSIACCLDRLHNDLAQSDFMVNITSEKFSGYIVHTSSGDIGWRVQAKKLMRYHGLFNYRQGEWAHCTKSLVAERIDKFEISLVESIAQASVESEIDKMLIRDVIYTRLRNEQ